MEDIRLIGTVVSDTGKELRNCCKIYIRDIGYVIVDHTYEELDNIQHNYLNGTSNRSIGFDTKFSGKTKRTN